MLLLGPHRTWAPILERARELVLAPLGAPR